jgi:hypothetical protein
MQIKRSQVDSYSSGAILWAHISACSFARLEAALASSYMLARRITSCYVLFANNVLLDELVCALNAASLRLRALTYV